MQTVIMAEFIPLEEIELAQNDLIAEYNKLEDDHTSIMKQNMLCLKFLEWKKCQKIGTRLITTR